MISIKECRELLGEKGMTLSDEEILEIRNFLYALARIGYDEMCKR